MKIRSTKQFKDGINAAFDTQESRAAAKRQCDDLARDFDERHETLCKYAAEHPEVFDVGTGGKSHEGATDRVKYKMTPGETLERIDGGALTDRKWLNELPDEYVRQKPELNKYALKGANLTDEQLAELGLRRVETLNMKLTAA